NQAGPGKRGQEKRQHPLHVDEVEKEFAVDVDELKAAYAGSLKKVQVVGNIDPEQTGDRVEKAERKQCGLELRAKQVLPRITKQHQAARPCWSQRSGVQRVAAPVDGHSRSLACQFSIAFMKISSSVSRRKLSRRMRTSRSAARQ